MTRSRVPIGGILSLALLCAPPPLLAQGSAGSPTPTGATAAMPDLSFTPTPEIEANYDKYFYFNRPDTDFATAYADLRECDGFARGLVITVTGDVPYQYAGTMAGAIGGVVANVMMDMIFGSAERRRLRRANMRTCMVNKDYTAFGLPETLWERFNFEEGNERIPEDQRQRFLQMQARVASGPRPTLGEMTP